MASAPALKLVCERELGELVSGTTSAKRWEASGAMVKEGHFLVVFDDRTEIARVSDDLQPSTTNGLFGMAHTVVGYEGITYNAAMRRYYLLVEARKGARGTYQALIVEYDDEFQYLKERPADFTF